MKKLFVIPFLALGLTFAACNNSSNNSNNADTQAPATEESASTDVADASTPQVVSVEANDQMKFNTDLITVKAGVPVELTLKNVGTMAKESMGHNFVVLHDGVDLPTFGAEAVAAADNEYIPKSSISSIIAHTKLLGPGEEDKITFTLEAGTYPFICSFPGHYGVMQGKIVAE